MPRVTFDRIANALIAVSAVAVALTVVRRETRPRVLQRSTVPSTYVSEWRDYLAAGRMVGTPQARITVVEFTDIECPFCRRFNEAVQSALAKHPNDVNYVVIHLPLPMHRFAEPAGYAAECAAAQGRFGEMLNLEFRKQDSLGLKSWGDFARDAGVVDARRFADCIKNPPLRGKLAEGAALASRLGITGTPAVYLNGWRYGVAPNTDELERAIGELLAGRSPYEGYPLDVAAATVDNR